MMSDERAQRSRRTTRYLGTWSAAMALGVALASSCYSSTMVDRVSLSKVAPRGAAPAGATFTIELVDRLDSDVPETAFDAVVVGPILAGDGSTIVQNRATVGGRATGVPGPNGGGLRLEFDSVETIHGKTTLSATFAPRQRDPSLAATDFAGPGLGYDALLGPPPAAPAPEARPPSAIGGGPREEPVGPVPEPPAAQPPDREPRVPPSHGPSMQLRPGTRLDLMLTRPLAPTRAPNP